jgi:hypothetical protein
VCAIIRAYQKRKELIPMAIDHRRHYVLNFDTETANTSGTGSNLDTSNALVYDCGWSVIDTKGNTYETASYVRFHLTLRI